MHRRAAALRSRVGHWAVKLRAYLPNVTRGEDLASQTSAHTHDFTAEVSMSNRSALGTLFLAGALALAACAGNGPAAPPGPWAKVVTGDELSRTSASTAYEALDMVRPFFLHTRGKTSILLPNALGPAVYVNGSLFGGVEVLRDILAVDVVLIRKIESWDAQTKYGPGYPDGVLEVTTGHYASQVTR